MQLLQAKDNLIEENARKIQKLDENKELYRIILELRQTLKKRILLHIYNRWHSVEDAGRIRAHI